MLCSWQALEANTRNISAMTHVVIRAARVLCSWQALGACTGSMGVITLAVIRLPSALLIASTRSLYSKYECDDSYTHRAARVLCSWQVLRTYIGSMCAMTPTVIGLPECFVHGKHSELILEV